MTGDERLRELYQEALARRATAASPAVALEQVEALAAGRLRGAEALAVMDRVMADPALQREFELLRSIHEAGRPREISSSRRWISIAAAAVLVIAVPLTWDAVRTGSRDDGAGRFRGGTAPVGLLAPLADAVVDPPVRFSWRGVDGALRYRVEVLAADGSVVTNRETPDTTLLLDVDALPRGAGYRWTVEAVTAAGNLRSGSLMFAVRAP